MKGASRSILIMLVLLAGCREASDEATSRIGPDKTTVETPEANCATRAVVDLLRDKVFDAAIAKVQAKEATKLNSLRSIIAGRLESPVMQSHDPELNRTACAGRIVFGLPPNTKSAFGGATQLAADVSFSVQPAADKSGIVIDTTGTEKLTDELIAGAKFKRKVTVAAAANGEGAPSIAPDFKNLFEPDDPLLAPSRVGPSFGCKGNLSRVERAVCNDPGLAGQDRTMADAYRDARTRTAPESRSKLEAIRLNYLGQRNRCTDDVCIAMTYDAWTSALYGWNP
jgi:hypothetical protein